MRAAIVLILAALYAAAPGTGPWCRSLVESARLLYTNRNASSEARATALLGDAYRLVSQVARQTPPGARIIIPTGPEADPVSNRIWCAYYLYPRRLLRRADLMGPVSAGADYEIVYTPTERRLVDLRTPRP